MLKYKNKKLIFRIILLVLMDMLIITAAGPLAIYVRYNLFFEPQAIEFIENIFQYLPVNLILTVIVFAAFRLYQGIWKYASASDLVNIILACLVSAVTQTVGMTLMGLRFPRSYPFMYFAVLTAGISIFRFTYRIIAYFRQKQQGLIKEGKTNTMIVGAGEAGNTLLKELQNSKFVEQNVCCLVDDDPGKIGKYLRGVLVAGNRKDICRLAEEYHIDEIMIAIPSASHAEIQELLDICSQTSCKLKVLPGIYQLVNGEVSVSKLRNVEIEDLLGREPIDTQVESIMGYVSGKVVLVTGGGGSIGSELCRQIARHEPKQLVIFDIYENNAYDIQQELKRDYPELNLVVLIGSVRNTHRINGVFEKYHPQIVYHAAAHKHVPLMEDSPNEAIKNNVMGTYKTAQAADKYGVSRFVLISTDKAVNPTNIMGASKRLCEMVIQMMNNRSKTEFVAVRFGNVLGSNGSVIPLFKKQIEEGGPVTVTHPDIIRYFMTIPEAVSLVLQAGAKAKGGEIFVLDMGKPVKILDLALNLIRLSGLKPYEDIDIVFTGLRPGEKLYEELLMDEEGLQSTDNKLIHIGKPIDFDEELFIHQLEELDELSRMDSPKIKEKVMEVVPTYHMKENGKEA
ncbi:polysaccharide biosynthesis protein [Clostridiales bacterium AM23-16LB]|nr:polysaccharide biosynthesis protein [Clostridiales bacterium AM23-16LB]RHR46323.1 polysaccharide biosynthesis protein [Clostridiaceae bacterium AF18-31LB]